MTQVNCPLQGHDGSPNEDTTSFLAACGKAIIRNTGELLTLQAGARSSDMVKQKHTLNWALVCP